MPDTRKTSEDQLFLMRMRTKRGIFSYIDSLVIVIIFILTLFSIALGLVILLLNGMGFLLWRAIVRSGTQVLALLFINPSLKITYPVDLFYIAIPSCFLGMILWGVINLRRYTRDHIALHRFSRSTSSNQPPPSLNTLVRMSAPTWISSAPVERLDPAALLKLLQEQAQLTDTWARATAALIEHETAEETSVITLLIVLADHLDVSFIGYNGLPVPFKVPEVCVSLIGFLTTQKEGEWISREVAIRQCDGGNGDTIDKRRERVNKEFNEAIAADPFLATEPDDEHAAPEKFDLIEYKLQGTKSFWRMRSPREVIDYAELTMFYQKVSEAEVQHENIDIEELRRVCLQIVPIYGRGYLSEHREAGMIWTWATERYRERRDQWIGILTYALQQEKKAFGQLQQAQTEERHAAMRQMATLYGWRALAAIGPVPTTASFGQEDLCQALSLWKAVKEVNGARSIFSDYVSRRTVVDVGWDVDDEIVNTWPDARLGQPLRTRKKWA